MSEVQIFNRSFLRGLETTRDEGGAPDFGGFHRFMNTRVGEADAERRGGMAVIARIPEQGASMQFNGGGTIESAANPAAWDLTRKSWCFEALIGSPVPGEPGALLSNGALEIYQLDGDWVVEVGGASLSSTIQIGNQHLAVVRDEGDLLFLIDGVVVDSSAWVAPASLDALTVIGSGWIGDIDFLRLRATVPSSWSQRELRLLNPRGRRVLFCMRDKPDANGISWDRSVYESHGRVVGDVAGSARVSTVPHNPVQLIRPYIDDDDRRRLFVVAGGLEFDAPLS